ncbi:SusC/RagA family TonB-linked outer membrane protein [Segetibacter sp.]|jgi:TonB-linked SusC/RagA family outer membrane protein|uniref:SusC/RagA family TonB-linked outer membrane protein n=1 Tax=Segetibacter sp. TaxID=2231182 RepID=UPI0026254128|nr:SusC/RagA family TonB-linked outer membrane protein [Segetibacter sp.]MCW3082209.1 rane protein [Segetibacter sp.]
MNIRRQVYFLVLPLLLFSAQLFGQDRTVTGRVVDSIGGGIQNASVVVKGGRAGTQTGADGTFSFKVPEGASALTISSVGFAPKEVSIATAGTVNVTLAAASTALSEVVVVGYGTQRKRDVTGAIATVTEKEFQKGNITSPEQMIAGKVAGVQITSSGGAPGSGSRILIRGGASLNASNDPLIVIDGVPVEGGVAGSANPLNMINPNDVESFTILKDPSAAAIYGSRASNGVVLITTKKGKRGKMVFNAAVQLITQVPGKKVAVLSGDQFRDIVNTKGGSSQTGKMGAANTNWQDEIFRTATGQDINLSASGALANGKLPIRISGNFLNQDGILRTGNFQRQSLGLNLSPRFFNDQLRVNINLKGARTSNRFAEEGAIGSAISFDPTQPVRVSSDRFGGFFEYTETLKDIGIVPKDLTPRNPVALLEMRDSRSEVYRSIGNAQFDYSLPFLKGLRANLNLGYDVQSGSGAVKISDSAASGYRRYEIGKNASGTRDSILNYGGVNTQYKSQQRNLLLDFYLNYVKDFGTNRVDFMVGHGYQDFKYTNFNFADYRFNGTQIQGSTPAFAMSDPRYTLISYYSRLNVTFANKYVFTLNARTDGTSKFAKNNRWGFFPSAAFAWRIKDEAFMKDSKTFSDLKFRIGYGVTGQQGGISFFGYIPRYERSNDRALYQLGNTFDTLYRPAAYDPLLKWETTSNINAAIDFGLFANRITGSVDVFSRKTKDLLSLVPIPLGTNFTNQQVRNVGNIESRGVEVTISAIPVQRKSFTWDFSTNFTFINPKITNLLLNPDPAFRGNRVGGISGGTGNTIQIQSVGYHPSTFYVLQQVYDVNGQPIEGLYEDQNRDGLVNDNDLVRYKQADPRFLLGMTNNFTYNKWSLGMVLRGSLDNYNYSNVYSNLGVARGVFNPLGFLNNASVNFLETNFTNNQYFSDYYIQNASFVRMDNINLGYDAGQVFKGARLRISANVQNAFVITKYKGIDPEINGGIDNQFYPRPRTYVLGLNLDF